MEKSNNRKILILIIIILTIIVIALSSYIIYEKFFINNSKDNVNEGENKNDTVEILDFYKFNDEIQDRRDTFYVTINGDVYMSSTYENFVGYNENDIKNYTMKDMLILNNVPSMQLNLKNIVKIYNVEYGTACHHYFAFLSSNNQLYFMNDEEIRIHTNNQLSNIVNVIDEERCEKVDENGNLCNETSNNCYDSCSMWAYAIDMNGNKFDLHDIEKNLSK